MTSTQNETEGLVHGLSLDHLSHKLPNKSRADRAIHEQCIQITNINDVDKESRKNTD